MKSLTRSEAEQGLPPWWSSPDLARTGLSCLPEQRAHGRLRVWEHTTCLSEQMADSQAVGEAEGHSAELLSPQ